MLWKIKDDAFGYDVTPLTIPATKRGILSTLSSVYDPLGFESPFILWAKIIFQEACRLSLGWDGNIADGLSEQWARWLKDLPDIANVTVSRCLKPMSTMTYQLHHFADASVKAYGAVSYLRITTDGGSVHTQIKSNQINQIKIFIVGRYGMYN